MHSILRLTKKRIVLLNGATGTNLLEKGLAPGESPSVLNIRDPEEVYSIQKAYVDAGSDVILTNTFSANPTNVPKRKLKDILASGARIARKAAGKQVIVLADIGPLGELVEPYGEMSFDEAYAIFKMIAGTMYHNGIKGFFIETFTSMIEAKAAFLATREYSKLVFVCFSLQDNGFTIMGESPEILALTFDALGARGVGINCTLPDVATRAVQRMAKVTNLPLVIKPNAGAVSITGTTIKHSMSDEELAAYFPEFVKAGANIIGGCCGTTPKYITCLRKKRNVPKRRRVHYPFCLVSPQKVVSADEKPYFVVGERMNPSGRKRVKTGLLKNDYSIYAQEAQRQESAGADLLDVNAYLVDRDETETLVHAVSAVLKVSRLPIFVDTQNFDAAQKVLRYYPGIGVLNSIPARKKELRKWLPMVRTYGFKAVISLIGASVPRTVKARMKNVAAALEVAREIRFPYCDLIFDPLVFSAATDSYQVIQTLETVRLLHKRGLKTVMGISNVSFGLPARAHLNAALISAAIAAGVTFMIVNPLSDGVQSVLLSSDALFAGSIIKYTRHMRERMPPAETVTTGLKQPQKGVPCDLIEAIIAGDQGASKIYAQALLDSKVSPQKIIDTHIAQALKQVGDGYESGKFFIPDLRKAADASKHALGVIKQHLPKGKKKGTIILATVKGDIHDIGKNIAGMIFESAGFRVIDLGKNVSATKIVQTVKKYKPDIVGLSALLTTTMPEMGRVIKRLREENLTTKVIIGGPNVSDAFAKKIGAFGAARTVLDGLRLLQHSM